MARITAYKAVYTTIEEFEADVPRVYLSYTPVAEGGTASITATSQGFEAFEPAWSWERSADGGGTWAAVDGAETDALEVLADAGELGALYRATAYVSTPYETFSATSDGIPIVAATE